MSSNRLTYQVLGGALLLCASLAQSTAHAENYASQWRQPLAITLPEPVRTVVLRRDADAAKWAATQNIANASIITQGRQKLVQFAMSEADWAQSQSNLCSTPGVVSCDSGACQTIQLRGGIAGAQDPKQVKAHIVRNPPDLQAAMTNMHVTNAMCRAPVALPALEETAAGQEVAIQVEVSEAEQEPTKHDFKLRLLPDAANAVGLQAGDMPADTTDYTLKVSENCRSISIPLNAVSPAHEPNLVVVLSAGSAQNIASRWGLTLISEDKLTASGETLAVLSTQQSIAQTMVFLRTDPDVIASTREHIYTTNAVGDVRPVFSRGYSDPFAQFAYASRTTGALALHASSTGEGETVAIIDTGVDVDHADLVGKVEQHDVTGKGWSADAHGTAVAGIIAAAADNALGSYGAAPSAKLLAIKACQPKSATSLSAKCWTSTLIKALDFAISKDATIINMSLAGPPDTLLEKFVAQIIAQDRLIIAGAGNGGPSARPAFPAALPGVLAVTATDARNRPYKQANVDSYIDLAAPGVDIITLAPNGSFPSTSGTSWAAAHVSGIAALLRPLMPLSKANEIAYLLESHAQDLGEDGKDDQYGHGLVNACAAAAAATGDAISCTAQSVN